MSSLATFAEIISVRIESVALEGMIWQALINVWPCAESSIWSFRAPKILEFISIQYLLYWRHIKNKGTTLVKAKLWNQEIIMVRKSSHRMAISQIWNNMTVRHPMRSDCDSTEAMLSVQFIYFMSLSIPDYSRHFDCQGRPSRIRSIQRSKEVILWVHYRENRY